VESRCVHSQVATSGLSDGGKGGNSGLGDGRTVQSAEEAKSLKKLREMMVFEVADFQGEPSWQCVKYSCGPTDGKRP